MTRSVKSPFAPLSKSNTEKATIDVDGSTNGSSICSHAYTTRFDSFSSPEQQLSEKHVTPKQQHPSA